MKKLLIFILSLSFTCCQKKSAKSIEEYCNKVFTEDHIGFMAHGGIFDKYDGGRVYFSICHIVDPKDWDYNEYFTGDGWSKNDDDSMKVLEKDSCQLKEKYFEYLLNK